MTTRAGTAFIDIQPRISRSFGAALGTRLRGPLKAVGVGAGVVLAGGLATGFAGFNIGKTFDEAFDQIRVGTGATGKELEGLQGDFREVFKGVPTTADDASTAISDLNTRLGVTGEPLQALSKQFLEMSRITKTDLGTNIEKVTRTFGDWGIETENMSGAMDLLFRASQATGPSVDKIGRLLVQFGAPLRQLGFGFEESATLLGKFEKEGVNTELVMGSLRIALGKMAREGEPAQETFERIVGEIENAGSASEANALALELFGARAGPDMAAALREGRFDISELFGTVAEGSETILGAAEDTKSFGERWTEFKNRVLVAIEPLARRVFEGVGRVFEIIAPKIESFITGTLIPAFDAISDWWGKHGPKIMEVIRAVARFINKAFGGISKATDDTWPRIQKIITGVMEIIRTVIQTVTRIIQAIWSQHGERIMRIVQRVWDTIKTVIDTVLGVIQGIIDTVMGLITGDWDRAWAGIKGIVTSIWDGIRGIIGNALAIIKDIIPIALDFIQEIWERAWDTVLGILGAIWDDIKEGVREGLRNIKDFFVDLPGNILSWLGDLGSLLFEAGKDVLRGLINGIASFVGNAIDSVKRSVGNVVAGVKGFFGIGSPSKVFAEIGRDNMAGLVQGMTEGFDEVEQFLATRNAVIPTGFGAMDGLGMAGGVNVNVTSAGQSFSLRDILDEAAMHGAV